RGVTTAHLGEGVDAAASNTSPNGSASGAPGSGGMVQTPRAELATGDGSLQGNRQHTPPAARPALGCSGTQGWWGACGGTAGTRRFSGPDFCSEDYKSLRERRGGSAQLGKYSRADCGLQCLRRAACKGRFKGRLCEDVAQQRWFSIDIGCTAKGQGEETCRKGTGSRKGEQGRPAGGEGRNAGTAGGSRDSPRAEAREKSDKRGSFSAPAATELESEDDKLAWRRLSELWVGVLLGSARAAPAVRPADLRGAPAEGKGET
ncbi:hypothetical protein AK812_SmicGene44528, partial [Symbiodinium microadriaticum]